MTLRVTSPPELSSVTGVVQDTATIEAPSGRRVVTSSGHRRIGGNISVDEIDHSILIFYMEIQKLFRVSPYYTLKTQF